MKKKWPWIVGGVGAAGLGGLVYLLTRKKAGGSGEGGDEYLTDELPTPGKKSTVPGKPGGSFKTPVDEAEQMIEEDTSYTGDDLDDLNDPGDDFANLQFDASGIPTQMTMLKVAVVRGGPQDEPKPKLTVKFEPGMSRLKWDNANAPLPSSETERRRWASWKQGGSLVKKMYETMNAGYPPFHITGCPSGTKSTKVWLDSLEQEIFWVRLMRLPGLTGATYNASPTVKTGQAWPAIGQWVTKPLQAKAGETLDFGYQPAGAYALDIRFRNYCPSDPNMVFPVGNNTMMTSWELIQHFWSWPESRVSWVMAFFRDQGASTSEPFRYFRLDVMPTLTVGANPATQMHVVINHTNSGVKKVRPLLSLYMTKKKKPDLPKGLIKLMELGEWFFSIFGLDAAMNAGATALSSQLDVPSWKIANMLNWSQFKAFKKENKPGSLI